MDTLEKIKNEVIISSQAAYGEPLYEESAMFAMIKSVISGGAKALRLAGERDIKFVKSNFDIPVIGITKPKVLPENWLDVVYITPTVKDVELLAKAGADIIAFDGTDRKRENDSVETLIKKIKSYNRLAMADVATFEDAKKAVDMGADIVSTTLSGYTTETVTDSDEPDFELLKNIVENLGIPAILEGRIWTREQVKLAFALGAHSVVIGSAVTRPQLIVKRFMNWR